MSQSPVARSRLPQFDAPRARSGHLCCRDRDNICFFISTRDPHSTYLAFPPPVAAPLLQSYRTSLAVLLQALEAASPLLRHSGRISYFRWGAALQWRQFRRAAATRRRSGIIGDDFQNALFALSLAPTSASQLPKNSSQLFLCSFLLQTSRYSKYVPGAGSALNVLEHMA